MLVDPPSTTQLTVNRDGYTESAAPNTTHESDSYLKVAQGKRTYMRTDISSITDPNRIVYTAYQYLLPTSTGSVNGGIDAARVLDPGLPNQGTLDWNNQPPVGGSVSNVSHANAGSWWQFDVGSVYQHYVDSSWPNYGLGFWPMVSMAATLGIN